MKNQQADPLVTIVREYLSGKEIQNINDIPKCMKQLIKNNKIWFTKDNILINVKIKR
jgi:hypothetical protein